jgi:nicotinamidase-related amidase
MNTSQEFRLSPNAVHLCIDMQRLFGPSGIWPTPWMETVLPRVAAITKRFPERAIFTRFIPPRRPEDMPGMWRRYYEKWRQATREHIDPQLLELMPPFPDLAPPALVIDKAVYSAFAGHHLRHELMRRNSDTVILTGAETDVCILSTALGAIGHGYRVIIAEAAVCSSSDQGHDSLLALFAQRFSQQIEVADTQMILTAWAFV